MTLTVRIDTLGFQATALHYSELPTAKVTGLMLEPNPAKAVTKAAALVQIALLSPVDSERFANLSMRETLAIIENYLTAEPVETPWPDTL